MNRTEFEALRDLPGKYINGDVRLVSGLNTNPVLCAEDVQIHNEMEIDVVLTVTFNPEISAFKCNVHVRGVGPICRVEINGPEHPGSGRTHKHSLQTDRCPRQNLHRNVQPRPDLNGVTLEDAWKKFCEMSGITHRGKFECEGIRSTRAL